METVKFQAMVVYETPEHTFERKITQKSIRELPRGDVLIQVSFSSLNYKDALSASGNKGVTRNYPHTPGIDAAGTVAETTASGFKTGDQVLVTGYDLGMNTPGGFGGYIRVPAEWVVRLPENLTLREAMTFGTAGFTAGLSVNRLVENNITPDSGKILVTGASGGVGSMAVSILARLGYHVTAVSGKEDIQPFLTGLGVKDILKREEFVDTSARPLGKSLWAGVVDTVGGEMLQTAIKSTMLHGAVTCCGNVASQEIHTSIYPFILRGVSLLGINSQSTPMPLRRKIWNRLAGDWKPGSLEKTATEISLHELDARIERMLKGWLKGRTLVNLKQ